MYSSGSLKLTCYFKLGRYDMKCLYEKKFCADLSRRHNSNVIDDYDSLISGLESGSKDVLCQRQVSLNPAADVLKIIQQDNEGVMERGLYFVTENADSVMRLAKKGDRRIAFKRASLVADPPFEINLFIGISKVLETPTCIRTKEDTMKDGRSQRILVSGQSTINDVHDTLYKKDVSEVLK